MDRCYQFPYIVCFLFTYIWMYICVCMIKERERGERWKERKRDRLIDWWGAVSLRISATHWHLMVLLLWQVLRYPDDVFLVGVLVVNHIVSDNNSPGPAWNALLSNTWQLMSGITSLWGFTVAWSGCVCVSQVTQLCLLYLGCWHGWKASKRGCSLNCWGGMIDTGHKCFCVGLWQVSIGLFPEKCYPNLTNALLSNVPVCSRGPMDV